MKEYNLEDQLKAKLNKREIAPSAHAWERIAHNRQQAKPKKRFALWYVAASVLFFMAGGYAVFMYLNTAAAITTVPGVVYTVKGQEASDPVKIITPQPKETVVQNSPEEALYSLSPLKSTNLDNEKAIAVQHAQVYAVEAIRQDVGISSAVMAQEKTIVSTKMLSSNDVYEAEAAMLLQQSAKEIAMDRQKAAPTNDTALLKEVETEMNDYYRDKAMRFFALKHKTIRFAVRDKQ